MDWSRFIKSRKEAKNKRERGKAELVGTTEASRDVGDLVGEEQELSEDGRVIEEECTAIQREGGGGG